ncbi:MAG: glycoside hydrolase family 25 protein [Oscillospiraceae bacterium]|nr:glycoside hydrolase family 25 protein [Oscillospiraceae bacterium]
MASDSSRRSSKGKRARAARRRRKWPIVLLILLVLLLASGVMLRSFIASHPHFLQRLSTQVSLFQTTSAGRTVLSLLTGVPAHSYDPSGFSKLDNGRITYQSGDVTAKHGVDVSVYQGQIDWNAVKADGIEFAMIRVALRGYDTEGRLAEDPNWKTNLQGALDAGLSVGVYIFSQATSSQEAEEEAAFLLERIAPYKNQITYPVVFDWESFDHTARTDNVSSATLTQACISFCEAVRSAGYTPMVYANLSTSFLQYDLQKLSRYPFWLAQYRDTPSFFGRFQIWQYSSKGTVSGISTPVDLNLSFVDYGAQ